MASQGGDDGEGAETAGDAEGAMSEASEMTDDGQSDRPWRRVPTAAERTARRTLKAGRKQGIGESARRRRGTPPTPQGFEVTLEPTGEDGASVGGNLLRIYEEVRLKVRSAHVRAQPNGSVVITVPNLDDVDVVRQIDKLDGVPMRPATPPEPQLWGRIGGVHPLFGEGDLLEALRSQGVEKVVREKYSARDLVDGRSVRVERPSQRVRLLFKATLPDVVTIAYESYRVSLCPAAPLQCFSCYRFGHRAAFCPRREAAPRCRRCGAGGHEMWECDNRARCVNCGGAHPANRRDCPVYAAHAQAAAERHVNRIATSIPGAQIEESLVEIEPEVAPATADGPGADVRSYAAVVGAPAQKKIVKRTDDGVEIVCRIPVPTQAARQRQAPPDRAKPRPRRARDRADPGGPADAGAGAGAVGVSLADLLALARRVWTFVRPQVEPLFGDNPLMSRIIDILMSDAVVQLILTSTTRGAAPGPDHA